MNWKSGLQIRDIPPAQRIEMTCRRCGYVHYLTADDLATLDHNMRLDRVERRATCPARGCRGRMRMAIIWHEDTSAFIGGLA